MNYTELDVLENIAYYDSVRVYEYDPLLFATTFENDRPERGEGVNEINKNVIFCTRIRQFFSFPVYSLFESIFHNN